MGPQETDFSGDPGFWIVHLPLSWGDLSGLYRFILFGSIFLARCCSSSKQKHPNSLQNQKKMLCDHSLQKRCTKKPFFRSMWCGSGTPSIAKKSETYSGPRIGENNPSNLGGKTLVESQNGRKPGKLAQENNNVSYMVGMILTNLSKRTVPKPTGQNELPGLCMFH